ncbi:MAG: hypothetical protein ACRDGB_04790, partial [Candidatus Limnocylindria bacterium]
GLMRLAAIISGYALLLATLANVLFFPNGWLPIWLAGGATALLSFDRKLGPIGAALMVMLAMPVGRGSEVGLPRILGDVPVRAHDLVPMLGMVLAVPAVVRNLRGPARLRWDAVVPVAVFAAVGVMALAIGLLGDQAMRDIVRDARWWAFYGVGLIALLAGIPRSTIIRALIWGMTIYCAVILIGLLMPLFHGGLKYGAYAYDPRMRLHYGQAVFLLVAIPFVVDRVVRRPTVPLMALLALLAAGIAVTLTRTLLAGVVSVGLLTAAWTAFTIVRPALPGRPSLVRAMALRVASAALAVLVGISGGFAVYQAGVRIWTPDWAYSAEAGVTRSGAPTDSRPVRPSLGRVFEDTANAGFDAQAGGRLASYAEAFSDTAESPVVGHGMGQLARISWAWGGFRASTPGSQPGVDNAYLTVGLKAGAVGVAAFAAMFLWSLRLSLRRSLRRLQTWFVPAWLAILGLTLIQSFAVSGYAPFALSLLAILPALSPRRNRSA